MKDTTYDYIHGTSTFVYQKKDMFRVNSDTALLATFMKIKSDDSVVDIGTNNGALLLHAAIFTNAKLIGIDIQEEACNLAMYNFNQVNRDVEIICSDVNNVSLHEMDVVVCNPPYFNYGVNSNVNESESLRIARHEEFLTLETLAYKSYEFLKDQGRLYLVHRSDRLSDIIVCLRNSNLEVKTIQFVHHRKNEFAHTVLIEALRGGKPGVKVLEPIYKE